MKKKYDISSFEDLRGAFTDMQDFIYKMFEEQDKRIDKKFTEQDIRIDKKFFTQDEGIDKHFKKIDQRFDLFEERINRRDVKHNRLEKKVDYIRDEVDVSEKRIFDLEHKTLKAIK